MIELHKHQYAYWEEINPGVVNQFPIRCSQETVSVLDVGCGSGALGEAIRIRGYMVWGIEGHAEACQRASTRLDKVIHLDILASPAVVHSIGEQRFDFLVFSDVLEHLYDPYSVLREYSRFLKPEGVLILSVPNALVWTNRLAFLFGRFEYADTGVMDRTHIRWFTFRSARRLVEACHFRIIKVDYTPFLIRAFLPIIKAMIKSRGGAQPRSIIDSSAYKIYEKWVYPVEYWIGLVLRRLTAFRIIIVARANII